MIFYLALGAQIGLADLAAGSSAAVSERLLAALDQPALVGQLCQFGEVIREHGGFATPVTR